MKKVYILFLLIAVFFTRQPTESQDLLNKILVAVSVSCEDDITKRQIESFIKRELRSLADVSIEDVIPNYTLSLTIIETEHKSGTKTGQIVVSSIFIRHYPLAEILMYYLPEEFTPNAAQEVGKKILEPDAPPYVYDQYLNSILSSYNNLSLQDISKRIVAVFDTEVLEKARRRQGR